MKVRKWLIGVFIFFVAIGVAANLILNPLNIVKQLLFVGLMIAVIYVIYRIWSGKKPDANAKRSYAMAVKQSKKRVKKQQTASKFSSPPRQKPLRKKSTAHLTVIDGNKNKPKSKKKDRAIY
ncbi:SA1362 family protein [Bacillus sp. FSL K6-3431]|uniref:SA1362 family protein n=1 Tax=Bacillus sp. FSL K6-3431 TaxID=2921500 RepID=UPI0030F8D088